MTEPATASASCSNTSLLLLTINFPPLTEFFGRAARSLIFALLLFGFAPRFESVFAMGAFRVLVLLKFWTASPNSISFQRFFINIQTNSWQIGQDDFPVLEPEELATVQNFETRAPLLLRQERWCNKG